MLAGQKIVLGVTGGIAAYKAVELCRLFVKNGADVRVVMTEAAKQFVTPLTFQTVSGNRVYDDLFAATGNYSVDHIGLAQHAGLFVIAPASANCIGKIASGIADDLLTTTVMAACCPVLLAPAMNTRMYENPITQQNMEKLQSLGYRFVHPAEGELACGDSGRGRLAPAEDIFRAVQALLVPEQPLKGIRILVTAGPTREPLDPVRYLTNHSSGKMGYAIARVAAGLGADVTLVSGPVLIPPPKNVETVSVTTACEMYNAVLSRFADCDMVIKAAAVADYRPAEESEVKIKKGGDMVLALVRNPDILAELGERKTKQILVGFAAETDHVLENALDKLRRKKLDLIVSNDLTVEGAGFNADTNVVTLTFADGRRKALPKMSKDDVAREIVREAELMLKAKKSL